MPSVFRRPKKDNPQLLAPAQSGLIPESDIVSSRRPYGSRNLRLSFEGRVSTSVGLFSQVLAEEDSLVPADEEEDELPPTAVVGGDFVVDESVADVLAREKLAAKKQRQWRKWSEDVIPALLQPYMALLRETEGLRHINLKRQADDSCDGCSSGRLLNVTCVYFESRLIFYFYLYFC
jgi:hypothetical protein